MRNINKISHPPNAGLGMKMRAARPIRNMLKSQGSNKNQTPYQAMVANESNVFRRHALERYGQRQGIPAPTTKSAAIPFRGMWNGIKNLGGRANNWFWTEAPISSAGETVKKNFQQLNKATTDPNLQKVLGHADPESVTGKFLYSAFAPLARAGAGALIGGQADGENGYTGTLLGAGTAAFAPSLMRHAARIGGKANPNTIRSLLQDKAVSNALWTDPLMRAGITGSFGMLADAGANAMGYDTGGWGTRLGLGAGLLPGGVPAMRLLASKSPGLGKAMDTLGATSIGKEFNRLRTTSNMWDPRSWAMGSPAYVTPSSTGMFGSIGSMGALIGVPMLADKGSETLNLMAQKKKDVMNILSQMPGSGAAQGQLEQLIKQVHGPQAKLLDYTGTPSREAIDVVGRLGVHGVQQLQQAGQNYFRDPQFLLNPSNWSKINTPIGALGQVLGAAFR
jgi:hypothetical protein